MKVEDALGVAIALAVIAITFAAVTVVFAIPIAIGAGGYAAYLIYRHYQNSDAVQERLAKKRTQTLYEAAKAREPAAPDKIEFGKGFARLLRKDVPDTVFEAAIEAGLEMYDVEGWGAEIPPPPLVANSIEGARYRDHLSKVTAITPQIVTTIQRTVAESMNRVLDLAPQESRGEPFITQPLHTFFPNLPQTVERAIGPFYRSDAAPYFTQLRDRLDRNFKAQKEVIPTEYKGENPVFDYLKDTPLHDVFKARVPVVVPRHIRHEHTLITGAPGSGKTTLLENLILRDIKDPACPSIVVIDSQRALIGKLSKLAAVHERPLLIIDPKDAPALNPFAFNQKRYDAYAEEGRERVRNHTMELFGYMFDSLLGAELRTRQGAMFTYMIQAMLSMPETMGRNATLEDLIDFTLTPEKYEPAIQSLSNTAKTFFATDFRQKYGDTKEQVRYRLHAILGNTNIARLFLAQENRVDFFEELNNGAIILIDTDEGFLGAKNSGYLGRIAITLLLQAILERDASGKPEREVFMYVDEAHQYFDRSIDKFLTEARKQMAGITLAHQHFAQMTSELRSSVATSTATKYAGGLSAQDARSAAPDMRTKPEFLLDVERLHFACYIRNVTKEPAIVEAKIGLLEKEQQATDEAVKAFRAKNKARLTVPPVAEKPQQEHEAKPKRKKSKIDTDPSEYA